MFEQADHIKRYRAYINVCRRHHKLLALGGLFTRYHVIHDEPLYHQIVCGMAGVEPTDLSTHRQALAGDEPLRSRYTTAIDQGRMPRKYKRYEDRFLNTANVVHYYGLIRDLRPSVVVETGTAAGSMTSWILAALYQNNHGKLISIDLPARAGTLTMDMSVDEPGYLIPRDYRDRWELIEGDAAVHLPRVLAENDVDVFIHDSLHTHTHMLFEYNVARRLLRPGAVIISDDVLWNRAWLDFVESHDIRSVGCITNPNQALAINTFSAYEMSQTPQLHPPSAIVAPGKL